MLARVDMNPDATWNDIKKELLDSYLENGVVLQGIVNGGWATKRDVSQLLGGKTWVLVLDSVFSGKKSKDLDGDPEFSNQKEKRAGNDTSLSDDDAGIL